MVLLSDRGPDSPEQRRLFAKAISRWDNEGGASDGLQERTASVESLADALPLTNAELVQLQIRVIALENMLTALLVEATDQQLELARGIADCITPRPGVTPHRLTIHAAARMISLIDRSGHLRMLQSAAASRSDTPDEKALDHPQYCPVPCGGPTLLGGVAGVLREPFLDRGRAD